jgi:uncharacterized RDD family membrane protein YckC
MTIDLLIIALTAVLGGIALGFTLGVGVTMLLLFFLRHGYFVWFETRWNGSTPGKSRFHLRVIRADGGPLTVETLLARNLTREVELFLPLVVLLAPQAVFGEGSGLVALVAVLWILLLLFIPLTNRHRLRVGDLLAGTRVVVSPPVRLSRDLADTAPAKGGVESEPGFRFTPEQLAIYGEHELTVLEEVLRKAGPNDFDPALAAVAKSICKRIGWTDEQPTGGKPAHFLRAFYAAQRRQLEHGLLLGRRRIRKAPKRGGK